MKGKIRMHFKKLTAGILGVAMVMGSVAALSGCKKETVPGENGGGIFGGESSSGGIFGGGNDAEVIKDDSVWYDVENVTVDADYGEVEYLNFQKPIVTSDFIYIPVSGSKKIDFDGLSETEIEEIDTSEYLISDLLKIDMSGNVVKKIPMDDFAGDSYVEAAYFQDGTLYSVISMWENDTYTEKILEFDVETDSVIDAYEIPINYDADKGTIETVKALPDGGVLFAEYRYDTSTYIFHIVENREEVASIDLAAIGYSEVWDASGFFNIGDAGLLIFFSEEGDAYPVNFDLGTYSISELDASDNKISYDDLWNLSSCGDGNSYSVDIDGIKELNTETFSLDTVFDFSNCNVRKQDLYMGMNLISFSEDSLVMAGRRYPTSFGNVSMESEFMLMIFTKADTNPNAGKTVVDIGIFGYNTYIPSTVDEAVYQFNETNPDYFARVSYLNYESYLEPTSTNEEPESWTAYENEATLELTNQLAIDLMSGDAPDIIINAASCSELNNEDYLLDLNELINGDNGIDTSLYYNNVFEAANCGGKLYQIPLAFTVNGISTNPENAPSNGIGFTYDEYAELVATVGNGNDPKAVFDNRLEYYANGLKEMGDLFIDIETGTVDFQNDNFYTFAEYCMNCVPETYVYDEFMGSMDIYSEFTEFNEAQLATVQDYATIVYGEEERGIYGLSSDGRGPALNIVQSAAISANCNDKDGAWAFILCLLSDDIQTKAGYDYVNPVNRAAARNVSTAFMDSTNETYEVNIEYYTGMSQAELRSEGMIECSEETMERYLEILGTADHVYGIDSAILAIAVEEIPAYFAGQKTIEDVAATINNRAQTVIDER